MSFQFLDVGMGDGTLVQMKADDSTTYPYELALVDFGEKRTPSKVPYTDAMKFLVDFIDTNSKARNTPTPFIDILFITHPDGDHYNKVVELVNQSYPSYKGEQLRFGRIVFGGNESDYGKVIKDLWDGGNGVVDKPPMPLDNKQHAKIVSSVPVPDWTFAGGKVNVYLLSSNYPTRGASAPNPKSLVLMFQCGGHKVVLQGDAEADVEKYVMQEFDFLFLKSTAMKLGHHGSKGASSPDWISKLLPQAIFASGDMRWAHPYCEPICRVLDANCLPNGATGFPVWYCCGAGHGENRIYWNNPTTKAICLNLWYVVKEDPSEKLQYGNVNDWKEVTALQGVTFGVQWLLYLPEKGKAEFGITDRAVPASGKSPTPFDCSSVPHEFVFVPSPEPAGAP